MASLLRTCAAATFLWACHDTGRTNSDSGTTDVFRQDQAAGDGNERRHKAKDDELIWTIDMRRCTGHLLAPEYMMTAAHCSPSRGESYRSGVAIRDGSGADIRVEAIEDINSRLDYAILRISWVGGFKEAQNFPPKVATRPSDIDRSRARDQGDEVFTVGFPIDKRQSWGATYSQGRIKELSGTNLLYNVGTINGNSGGGVWRKSDKMLVSLTNGGPHRFGEGAWNTGDASDSSHWNNGAAMWNIYADSQTLQDIFPNGKNRFSKRENKPLFIALGRESKEAADSYEFYVSAPEGTTSVLFITTREAPNATLKEDGAPTDNVPGRPGFFRSSNPLPIEDNMVIEFVALDGDNEPLGRQSVKITRK